MKRTAYLTSGHWFEQSVLAREPYTSALDPLYLPDLDAAKLAPYETAIVGSRGDADVLAAKAPQLIDYWCAGGNLIAFDQPALDWLPGATYEWSETNFWWWRTPGEDLALETPGIGDPLLRGLAHEDLKWHYHGFYRPPPGARALVTNGAGGAVLYTDLRPGSGLLVATTMDPDYHTGQGFIPKAEGLLEHLVGWATAG